MADTHHASSICFCGHPKAKHFGRGPNRQCNGAGYVFGTGRQNCTCRSFRLATAPTPRTKRAAS